MSDQETQVEEERDFSVDEMSDTPSEIDNDEIDQQSPWRKGRLEYFQYTLKTIEQYCPERERAVFQQAEKGLVELFDTLEAEISVMPVQQSVRDDVLGELLLKAAYLLNEMRGDFVISLKRPAVTRFLGKALEYVLTYEQNYYLASRILPFLNRIKFSLVDLSCVNEVLKRPETLKLLTEQVWESQIPKDINLRVGGATIKNFATRFILKLVSKINYAFKENFPFFIQYMFTNNIEILTSQGLTFCNVFIPFRILETEQIQCLLNEFNFRTKLDDKISSKTACTFLSRLSANRRFIPHEETIKRVFYDSQRLYVELGQDNNKNQLLYCGNLAYMFIRLLTNKANEAIRPYLLENIVGFFDTLVDYFHPKSNMSVKKKYAQKMFSKFVGMYVKELKNKNIDEDLKKQLKDALDPIFWKMMNFALFDSEWQEFYASLMELVYFDKEFYLEKVLKKLQFALEFDEFKKDSILRILGFLSSAVVSCPVASQSIYWIVPKIIKEFDNAANQATVQELSGSVMGYIEAFTSLQKHEAKYSYLEKMKDDIDEAALMVFNFFCKKAKDFKIEASALDVIYSLGDYVQKKVNEKVFEFIRSGFADVSEHNAQMFLTNMCKYKPEETEMEMEKWLLKKALTKLEQPTSLDNLTLKGLLERLGVTQLEYNLGSSNEAILKRYIAILTGITRHSTTISDDFLRLSMTFLALAFDSEFEPVTKISIEAISVYLEYYIVQTSGGCSFLRMKEAVGKKTYPEEIKWTVPETDFPERTRLLFETLVVDTIIVLEKKMADILNAEVQSAKGLCVVELYSQTVGEKSEEKEDQVRKAKLKSFGNVLHLLCGVLSSSWVELLQVRSCELRNLLTIFRERLTFFVQTAKCYSDVRVTSPYLKLFYMPIIAAGKLIYGDSQTAAYTRAMKPFLQSIAEFDTAFKLNYARGVYYNALIVANNFEQSNEKLIKLDFIEQREELKAYQLGSRIRDERASKWILNGEVYDYFIGYIYKVFSRQTILYTAHYKTTKNFNTSVRILREAFVYLKRADFEEGLMAIAPEILRIDHMHEQNFNKTCVTLEMASELAIQNFVIGDQAQIEKLLSIPNEMMKKGNFNIVYPSFMFFVNYVLNATMLDPNSPSDRVEESLAAIWMKSDQEVTLVELVNFTCIVAVQVPDLSKQIRAKVLFFALKNLNTKNINKRIILMSLLALMNRVSKQRDYELKDVMIQAEPFTISNGSIPLPKVQEIFQQIKYQIGFSQTQGKSLTAEEKQALSVITEDSIPDPGAPQNLSLPFRTKVKVLKEDTIGEFRLLMNQPGMEKRVEDVLYDFTLMLISEYSDTINEENLNVKYNFADSLIDTKGKFSFNKESLFFATFRMAFRYAEFSMFKRIINRLVENNTNDSSDFKKVLLNLISYGFAAAIDYTEAEFKELCDISGVILRPFMNSINFKYINSFLNSMSTALKSNLSFKKLKTFFTLIRKLQLEDTKENNPFYINVLVYEFTSSNGLISDQLVEMLKESFQDPNLEDLNSIASTSRLIVTVIMSGYIISYSCAFLQNGLTGVRADEAMSEILPESVFDTDTVAADYLERLLQKKIIVRMEAIKVFTIILFNKKIHPKNLHMVKQISKFLFRLDPNEDSTVTQMVLFYHKIFDSVKVQFMVQDEIREQLQLFFMEAFDTCYNMDCQKTLLKFYRISFANEITPTLNTFILRMAMDTRVTLKDQIASLLRNDLFGGLSDARLFAYCKELYRKVETVIKERSMIKDKNDDGVKKANKSLEGYITILIAAVSSRKWQMNAEIEKCLEVIVQIKKNSPDASKKFSYFITEFWSKKTVHEDFNDYEVNSDLKEELRDYNNPYSYFA